MDNNNMKIRKSPAVRTSRQDSENQRCDSSDGESDSSGEPGLFSGLVAWFSTSVHKAKVKSWVDGEGTLATSDIAMFLFSEDPEAEDTLRLYEGEAYRNEYIAIFHADVVFEFIRQGGVKKVALGKYFLPPKDVHEVIKRQVSFKWETNAQLARRPLTLGPRKKTARQQKNSNVTVSQTLTTSREEIHDQTGGSSDVIHQSAPGSPLPATTTRPAASDSRAPGSPCSLTSSEKRKRSAGDKPTKRFSTAYIDISQLSKVNGEIKDFTYGQNGCQVVSK